MLLISRYVPKIGIYFIMVYRIFFTVIKIIPQMAFFLFSFTVVFSIAINDDIINFTSSGKPYYWLWSRFLNGLEYEVIDINEEERNLFLTLVSSGWSLTLFC